VDLKPKMTEEQELVIRLARMHQLLADLEEAIATVDRHREELNRIKRDVAALTKSINGRT
jgi:hypothetical protein